MEFKTFSVISWLQTKLRLLTPLKNKYKNRIPSNLDKSETIHQKQGSVYLV